MGYQNQQNTKHEPKQTADTERGIDAAPTMGLNGEKTAPSV